MSVEQQKTTLRFQINSLDRDRPIMDAVPAAENLSSELQAILAVRFPGVRVEIRRVEGIPFAHEVQELLLQVDWHAVGVAVETTTAGWVTKEFLKLLKAKVRNVFAKPLPDSSAAAGTSSVPEHPNEKPKAAHSGKKAHRPRKSPGGAKKKSKSPGKKRRK